MQSQTPTYETRIFKLLLYETKTKIKYNLVAFNENNSRQFVLPPTTNETADPIPVNSLTLVPLLIFISKKPANIFDNYTA